MKKRLLILCSILLTFVFPTFAQTPCADLLTSEYISDGQYYSTQISNGEEKNCSITLIGGNEYRIIVCPHTSSNIQMQLIDEQGNILFNNEQFSYTNYWDFQIKKTLSCTIKLNLVEKSIKTDNVILLIGFKK